MFANLLHLLTGRDAEANYDHAFVREVHVRKHDEPRSRRSERLLIVCWVLIGLKCWGTWWLIGHYHVPFSPWWVIAPTLGAAAVCTWLYLRR